MEEEPNGDEAVVGVGDPKMEGDFAAVEVAPPPKIDPDIREVPQFGIFAEKSHRHQTCVKFLWYGMNNNTRD